MTVTAAGAPSAPTGAEAAPAVDAHHYAGNKDEDEENEDEEILADVDSDE